MITGTYLHHQLSILHSYDEFRLFEGFEGIPQVLTWTFSSEDKLYEQTQIVVLKTFFLSATALLITQLRN